MRRQISNFNWRRVAAAVPIVVGIAILSLNAAPSRGGALSSQSTSDIAHGAGTTYVQGGTGAGTIGSYPTYTPIFTRLGFHAEKNAGVVTGSLDCLALAPESTAGVFNSQSAQFTVNVMYVTGPVTGAVVSGNTATLTGTANVTGLGAGTNVPFTFVVQGGGPGATAVLTVSGLTFNEVLLDGGSFQVGSH